MKKQVIITSIVLVLLITIAHFNALIQEIPITISVSDKFEVDLDKNLNFGTVPAGMETSKKINITNNGENKKFIHLQETSLTAWIYFSENNFILKPNEINEVTILIKIPKNAMEKTYESKLNIYAFDYLL